MKALSRAIRVGLTLSALMLVACTSSSPGPATTVDVADESTDIDLHEDDTPDASPDDAPLDEIFDVPRQDVFSDRRDVSTDASADRATDITSDVQSQDDGGSDGAFDVILDRPVDAVGMDAPAVDAGPPDEGPIDTGPVDTGSCDCATEMNASVACVAGTCQSTCNAAFARCDGACVTASATRCGADCHECPMVPHGAPACVDGRCVNLCEPGYFVCPDGCCLFREERVAPDRLGGIDPGLAIGASGDQLLYSTFTENMLTYAHLVGGVWQREPVQQFFSTSPSNVTVHGDVR